MASFERYAIGTMDHSSAITDEMRYSRLGFCSGLRQRTRTIRKQMGDLGLKPQVLSMIAGPAYKEFVDATGAQAENVSSASWWHPAVCYNGKDVSERPNIQRALAEEVRSGSDYAEASAAVSGAIFQLAMEAANAIDPKKVRDALAGMDVMTFYGHVKFGSTGQITTLNRPIPDPGRQAHGHLSCDHQAGRISNSVSPGFGRLGMNAGTTATRRRPVWKAMIYLQILANGIVLGGSSIRVSRSGSRWSGAC